MSSPKPTPAERVRRRLVRDEATGCETWTGPLDHKGYARVAVGGQRNKLAHRVAYEAAKGPIPAGLTLDHLCRNKACCNPDRLEPVTSAENTRRKASPDHCPSGHAVVDHAYFDCRGRRRCHLCELMAACKRLAASRAERGPCPVLTETPSDLEDEISDALQDSLGPDWTCRDGAQAIVRMLEGRRS